MAVTYQNLSEVASLSSVSATDTVIVETGGLVRRAPASLFLNSSAPSTDVDLSAYAKTADVEEALALKADASTVETLKTSLSAKADSSSVYTKTEADTLLSAKADSSTVTALQTTVASKADASDVYTKEEVDSKVAGGGTFDSTLYYTKTATDTLLSAKADSSTVSTLQTTVNSKADSSTVETLKTSLADKANASDVYTQAETDTLLADKADAEDVYTKSEADTLLASKAGYLIPAYGQTSVTVYIYDSSATAQASGSAFDSFSIGPAYAPGSNASYANGRAGLLSASDKTKLDGLEASLALKADVETTYTKTETDELLADKADASATYTKEEVDAKFTGSGTFDSTQYYTKTETDEALALKAAAEDVYTKDETNALLGAEVTLGGRTVTLLNGVCDLGECTNDEAGAFAALSEVAGDNTVRIILWHQAGGQTGGGQGGLILNVQQGYRNRCIQYRLTGDTAYTRFLDGATGEAGATVSGQSWSIALPQKLGYTASSRQLRLIDYKNHDLGGGSVTLPEATTEAAGLMSAADKTLLATIEALTAQVAALQPYDVPEGWFDITADLSSDEISEAVGGADGFNALYDAVEAGRTLRLQRPLDLTLLCPVTAASDPGLRELWEAVGGAATLSLHFTQVWPPLCTANAVTVHVTYDPDAGTFTASRYVKTITSPE